MEYKGFNYQPGNVYNFECLQEQADSASSTVVIPTVVPEYNAEEYNNYEEYWSYESFCDWLVVTLEVAGLSPDCAGLALSCLEHQDDLAAYLYTTGIDRSIVEDLVGQIYSQYSAINYAENSNDAQELYDETSAVAEEPIDEEDGEWDMMVEDVVDDEGFNFLEKALALDELIASKIDSGSLSPSSANFSADATWQALCIHSGDITLSYRSLESALQKLNDCRPCRHRLQGSCLRSDCKFDHSLADVPCRFWLLTGTGCTLEECPFSHHISVVSDGSTRFSNDVIGSADMNADSEQFPQLGAKDRSDSISYATKTSTGIKSTSVSYREVAASASLNPQPQLKNTYSSASAPKKVRSICSETFGINDWVESGQTMRETYQIYRVDARQNAVARNRLFEEATRAYMSGRRDVAKALSLRGKEANALMKECHMEGSKEIFRSRNTMESISKGQIDIHGLHVAEMKTCMDEMLPYFSSKARFKVLKVVTGSGHHSSGPQKGEAKLLPGLVSYCTELELEYNYILDPNGIKCGLLINLC